jgi:hypothetical protein
MDMEQSFSRIKRYGKKGASINERQKSFEKLVVDHEKENKSNRIYANYTNYGVKLHAALLALFVIILNTVV